MDIAARVAVVTLAVFAVVLAVDHFAERQFQRYLADAELYEQHHADVLADRRQRLVDSQQQLRTQFPELADFRAKYPRLVDQQPVDRLTPAIHVDRLTPAIHALEFVKPERPVVDTHHSAVHILDYFAERNPLVREQEQRHLAHRLDAADEQELREQFAAAYTDKLAGYVEGDDAWVQDI